MNDIETRIFAYSRRVLTQWQAAHEKEHKRGSWAAAGGPSPENIGLHRLAEHTVLRQSLIDSKLKHMSAEQELALLHKEQARRRGT